MFAAWTTIYRKSAAQRTLPEVFEVERCGAMPAAAYLQLQSPWSSRLQL